VLRRASLGACAPQRPCSLGDQEGSARGRVHDVSLGPAAASISGRTPSPVEIVPLTWPSLRSGPRSRTPVVSADQRATELREPTGHGARNRGAVLAVPLFAFRIAVSVRCVRYSSAFPISDRALWGKTEGVSGENMSTTVYDQNVDFYIDLIDRALKANRYLPLLAVMTDLIGARLNGARVCDLCCGEGYLGRYLIAHGAQEVLGMDTSAELLERARARSKLPDLTYRYDDAQSLSSLTNGTFDVVASQLAMMDVADHRALFAAVRRVLVPHGVFVFSTLHPCFKARPFHVRDAPENLLDEKGQPIGVVIRRYAPEGHFNSGGDGVRGHMGSYHRMISSHVNDLLRAGFVLERLEEPLDGPANGELFSEVPMVLVIAARAA